jgi:solute carrier family 20 (sodium-dependent phosphate transporter)
MTQAMTIANKVCEFAGSMMASARVAETVRTKIIPPQFFTLDPVVLMLAIVCAIIESSTYLSPLLLRCREIPAWPACAVAIKDYN